jgi:hypothetical protein
MEISKDTTLALTFTAAELFALQQALLTAGYSADDEAKAHREVAYLAGGPNGTAEAVERHMVSYDEATARRDLYMELASRVGHRATELPEDVPAGFGNFPRRGDGGQTEVSA